MRKILWGAILGAAGLLAPSTFAGVDATTLASLLDGGTVTVGDKQFSDFTYARTGDMPTAENVNVISVHTFIDGIEVWGVRFQGQFQDLAGGSNSDALITYTVTVTDPTKAISDAHIAGNVSAENGVAEVVETFIPEGAPAKIKIYSYADEDVQMTDITSFLPNTYRVLHVQKDIGMTCTTERGLVSMSYVDQTFSQVPEPATLGLLGLAAPALLLRRRRRA